MGGTEVHLTVKGTTKTLSGTRYYTANGQTIAVRTAVSGTTGTKLSFLAGDHHGTSNIVLDASTYAFTKRYSTPFGGSRGPKATNWPDDKAFLGKPADESTGLTHVGAREYDPGIGQFISVDPVLMLDQHQSLNGYAYASNTPVTSSDPTGLCEDPGNGHCQPDNGGQRPQPPDPAYGNTNPPYNGPYDGTRESVGLGGGTASTNSSGNTRTGKSAGPKAGPGDSEGCGSWGFAASFCSGVGEVFYGVVSNIPHAAEYYGWVVDGDCRDGGGPGSPGCDYGTQFDNWIAGYGYDIDSDAYQAPSAVAAIFGVRPGAVPSNAKGNETPVSCPTRCHCAIKGSQLTSSMPTTTSGREEANQS
ncbi:hypothetical protein SALBM311S_11566 [Streptomyces alboniger]